MSPVQIWEVPHNKGIVFDDTTKLSLFYCLKLLKNVIMSFRVHSISRIIATPLLIIAGYILYRSFQERMDTSWIIFVPASLLVVLYVFHGPLDHWYLTKFPPVIDSILEKWLYSFFKPYAAFSESTRKKFNDRLMLYLEGRLFYSVGQEKNNLPEDIKCMIAAHGIHMSLGFEDYLIGDMDRIFLYKHPFPSPALPSLHNVEIHVEDGVILLSLEQLQGAILYPEQYYNTAYHAYAESIFATHTDINQDLIPADWALIERIAGWSNDDILSQTGLPDVSAKAVLVVLFFSMPEKFNSIAPDTFLTICRMFRMDV